MFHKDSTTMFLFSKQTYQKNLVCVTVQKPSNIRSNGLCSTPQLYAVQDLRRVYVHSCTGLVHIVCKYLDCQIIIHMHYHEKNVLTLYENEQNTIYNKNKTSGFIEWMISAWNRTQKTKNNKKTLILFVGFSYDCSSDY